MPRVTRRRPIAAPAEAVWEIVSDPWHLPRWWPGVQRVEEASPLAWTKVLRTPRGKTVRADFTRLRAEPPHRLSWRQELVDSPFERILSEAVTEVELVPAGGEVTEVRLRAVQRLRGLSRLGFVMVRRATARQLDEALAGLDAIAGDRGEGDPGPARTGDRGEGDPGPA